MEYKQLKICGSAGKDRFISGLKYIRLANNEASCTKNFKFSFSCIYENILQQKILLIFHAAV
jgi:hypothetical protein